MQEVKFRCTQSVLYLLPIVFFQMRQITDPDPETDMDERYGNSKAPLVWYFIINTFHASPITLH